MHVKYPNPLPGLPHHSVRRASTTSTKHQQVEAGGAKAMLSAGGVGERYSYHIPALFYLLGVAVDFEVY